MNVTSVGIDLAKTVFAVCVVRGDGSVAERRELKREEVLHWLSRLRRGCIVGMEACGSAHHWARRMAELGLEPRIIPAEALMNRMRGLLAEFGVIYPRSSSALRRGLAEAIHDERLPLAVRELAGWAREDLAHLDQRIAV